MKKLSIASIAQFFSPPILFLTFFSQQFFVDFSQLKKKINFLLVPNRFFLSLPVENENSTNNFWKMKNVRHIIDGLKKLTSTQKLLNLYMISLLVHSLGGLWILALWCINNLFTWKPFSLSTFTFPMPAWAWPTLNTQGKLENPLCNQKKVNIHQILTPYETTTLVKMAK